MILLRAPRSPSRIGQWVLAARCMNRVTRSSLELLDLGSHAMTRSEPSTAEETPRIRATVAA
jgi:hypothetical protein